MKKIIRFNYLIILLITGTILFISCSKNSDKDEEDNKKEEQPLTGKFAFVSYDDNDGEIYTVNADGTDLRKLTDNNVNDIQPAWSPDGSKIAFYAYGYGASSEIYVMNADGTGITQITHDPVDKSYGEEWPSWSPDGNKIIYESYRDAVIEDNGTTIINANLYTSNANGTGGDVRITSHLFFDGNPAWSPDGSKIAFVHAQIDTINSKYYSSGYQIWLMNSNGTDWKKLTVTGSNNIRPKWSPDGTKIVYQSDEGIQVVTPDGQNLNLLNNGGTPSWSPDGTKIVFDRNDEIYVMNADGTNVRKITLPLGARQVVWTE
ncbi:MAG: hypothetical protein R6W78_18755 [Bacteroidales bacterium]